MAGCFGVIGCLVVIAVAVMGAATAETNTVGDSLGWKVPPGGAIAYSTWANKQTFEVGDALVFNWTGTQDVARVPKDQFNNCTANFVFGTTQTTSPANFTLESNVTHYHICTIDSHCYSGQKLEITTGSNGASPLAAGAFSVVLLALAVSLMSHM